MSKTTLRTEKRMITLPVICWEEIDKIKDGYTIKSHGEALLSILLKIYPNMKDKIYLEAKGQKTPLPQTDISKQSKTIPDDILKTPSGRDFCICGHPRGGHVDNKCIANRCVCEEFRIDIETTRQKRIEFKETA